MEKGYAGRIKNKGNQVVEAPYKTAAPKRPKVKTGKDLRAGKSGKVLNNVDFNNGTCTISTDGIDEFDNMLAYKQSKQKEELELQREIFKKIKSSKT